MCSKVNYAREFVMLIYTRVYIITECVMSGYNKTGCVTQKQNSICSVLS